MSCERYEALLKQAAAALPATPELEAHLRACAACARRMGEERLLAEIASSLETAMRAQPSPDFLARVRGRVSEERTLATTGWPGPLVAASVSVALAVIGAAVLGRVPPPVTESWPSPIGRTAPAAPAGPPSGIAAPAVSPTPARSPRYRPAAATAGRPETPKAGPGAGVVVEPGQQEALARLVERGLPAPALSRFVVESLDQTPLPELRPVDLPRFEAKPLPVRSGGWQDPGWEAGGPASDRGEGSDS